MVAWRSVPQSQIPEADSSSPGYVCEGIQSKTIAKSFVRVRLPSQPVQKGAAEEQRQQRGPKINVTHFLTLKS